MKFCKDCKHYRENVHHVFAFITMKGSPEFSKCAAFPNLVTGEAGRFCDIERDSTGLCGEEGRLWDPA